ncbi:ABC transporter permease [Sporomusa acidovorans]|uniref:Transport permease protein n=1 Tax=Sporomusa acidovorans (strain ATCC 49682 / DSM 3132 / Mol) TaxID=1123286 RepID=A0ABZ3JB02_SPOA4|nr:ABC transporter permease [Sporomusa acidovorans]OZC21652.1 inner membrane transport permease YadH [Sporomusa acidovorans DSM 3132]SDD61025.1 lipooligosaccharide transport system permease protein [Sporomusa acidovorans]
MAAIRIFARHMAVFRKIWFTTIMFNFIEPLLYLTAMGYGLGTFVQDMEGLTYLQYIAPGMVASSAMFAASFECTYGSFIRLHYQKTFQAMLAGPVRLCDIVAGEILYATFKSMVFGVVILSVISALGQVRSWWALVIPVFLIIPGLAFSLLAICYTGITANIDNFNYYITLFLTPAYLFSGVFFPIDSMPGWAQAVAWVNPIFHSVEVCRAMALGNYHPGLLVHAGVLAVLAVFLLPLAVRLLTKRLII